MSFAMRRTVGDLEAAMRRLVKAGEGVPYRVGGFANVRKQLAREVATFAGELEGSASLMKENFEDFEEEEPPL